jgi:hypothetical protein
MDANAPLKAVKKRESTATIPINKQLKKQSKQEYEDHLECPALH